MENGTMTASTHRDDHQYETPSHGAHTPGPWAPRALDAFTGLTEIVSATGRPIAKAYRNNDQATAEANARLITAAPDMLLTLAEIAAKAELAAAACDNEGRASGFRILAADARAAIAKAEGRP